MQDTQNYMNTRSLHTKYTKATLRLFLHTKYKQLSLYTQCTYSYKAHKTQHTHARTYAHNTHETCTYSDALRYPQSYKLISINERSDLITAPYLASIPLSVLKKPFSLVSSLRLIPDFTEVTSKG